MHQAAGDWSPTSPPRRSLADRVSLSRRAGFVGRAAECQVFDVALRGAPPSPQILLVHGIGGIGKSTLLRRWAQDTRDAGDTVAWLDGEQVGVSISAFEKQITTLHSARRPVLFVDGFEHCQALETWLREQFLPTLPETALIVIAGRCHPQPQWTVDRGWRDLVTTMELGPLEHGAAIALLHDRGVTTARQPAVYEFAGGHPLALCMAAAAASADTTFDDATWAPGPDVVIRMLHQMIDRAPSPAHRYGLRVCAHVRHTTVAVLRTGLDDDAALTVFDWLSGLPWVELTEEGLLPHELVRDMLDAHFAWQDPHRHAELHLLLWCCLADRARTASGDIVEPAIVELMYLLQHRAPGREPLDVVGSEALVERAYSPELRESLLHMTCDDQGDQQARLLDHWLQRHPDAFHIYCRADDMHPVSVNAWLRLHPDRDDFAADPVLLPIRNYLDQHGLDSNHEIGISRFLVPAPVADQYRTSSVLHVARMSLQTMSRQDNVVATFVVMPVQESAYYKMELFGYSMLSLLPEMDGRDWAVLVRDRREPAASAHLDRLARIPARQPDDNAACRRRRLSREEHDRAVRRILRDWHDDDAVAANPLVGVHGDHAIVRGLVRRAIATLSTDPGKVKHQRVLRMTYLERTTSQEATAAHLDIPFSTYRRYLTAGVQQMCEHLWSREAAMPPPQ